MARSHELFEDRLKAAYELKEVADNLFHAKMFLDAVYKYEHAIGVFRWLTNKVLSIDAFFSLSNPSLFL